jgi:hypothetical protein
MITPKVSIIVQSVRYLNIYVRNGCLVYLLRSQTKTGSEVYNSIVKLISFLSGSNLLVISIINCWSKCPGGSLMITVPCFGSNLTSFLGCVRGVDRIHGMYFVMDASDMKGTHWPSA